MSVRRTQATSVALRSVSTAPSASVESTPASESAGAANRFVDDPALLDAPLAVAAHVGRPNVGSELAILGKIRQALESRWLTNNGPMVQELEHRIARLLDVEHCVLVSNATSGIEATARALGLTGEVIVPGFTFVATAHALSWVGLEPVFCDIDPVTQTIDVASAERAITDRTSAIVGVHLWGRPCPIDELTELCRRRGLKLVLDAAHAFGCGHEGRLVGGFGDAEVFSFHATKFFNTAEGGAITTNDGELAARLRRAINFGFAGLDRVESLGTNAKMSEIHAAIGLANLDFVDRFVTANARNHAIYAERFAGVPGIRMVTSADRDPRNFQYVVAEIDPVVSRCSRDDVVADLVAVGVLARRYFAPGCHRMDPYVRRPNIPELPGVERAVERTICLPTGEAVDPELAAAIAERVVRRVTGPHI